MAIHRAQLGCSDAILDLDGRDKVRNEGLHGGHVVGVEIFAPQIAADGQIGSQLWSAQQRRHLGIERSARPYHLIVKKGPREFMVGEHVRGAQDLSDRECGPPGRHFAGCGGDLQAGIMVGVEIAGGVARRPRALDHQPRIGAARHDGEFLQRSVPSVGLEDGVVERRNRREECVILPHIRPHQSTGR